MDLRTASSLADRILVIVPHSDDEALLTAGVIRSAVLEGKHVSVAIVTNGDYQATDHRLAEVRIRETRRAMHVLGVPAEQLYFLGYADTGMPCEESFLYALYNSEETVLHPSSCSSSTYGISGYQEDYHFLRTGSHGAYTKMTLCEDLDALLEEVRPQQVFTTSCYEMHGDHIALCWFMRDAICRWVQRCGAPRPELFEGIVHSLAGDENWPPVTEEMPDMTPPPGLEQTTPLRWKDRVRFPLPPDLCGQEARKSGKYALIRSYESQMKEDEEGVIDFLTAFAKADEIFWRYSQ